jgi:hypothetical protein
MAWTISRVHRDDGEPHLRAYAVLPRWVPSEPGKLLARRVGIVMDGAISQAKRLMPVEGCCRFWSRAVSCIKHVGGPGQMMDPCQAVLTQRKQSAHQPRLTLLFPSFPILCKPSRNTFEHEAAHPTPHVPRLICITATYRHGVQIPRLVEQTMFLLPAPWHRRGRNHTRTRTCTCSRSRSRSTRISSQRAHANRRRSHALDTPQTAPTQSPRLPPHQQRQL